jgi:hypothetical protein
MRSIPIYFIFAVGVLLMTAGCGEGKTPGAQAPDPKGDSANVGNNLMDFDGNSYPALQFGDQVWMGTSLLVTHGPDSEPLESFCYDDQEENCINHADHRIDDQRKIVCSAKRQNCSQ